MTTTISSENFTLEELRRAYRDLDKSSYQYDDLVKVVDQARKNRIVDEAMKAHDSRPDLRSQR